MIPIGARIEVLKQDELERVGSATQPRLSLQRRGKKTHRDCALRDRRVGCTKCKEIQKKRPENNGQSRR